MNDAQRKAAARAILDNEITGILLNEMEATAMNACVYAKPADHETRAAYAAEVRAIRNFRSKLNSLLGEVNAVVKGAPA